jgi:hypothetical protein
MPIIARIRIGLETVEVRIVTIVEGGVQAGQRRTEKESANRNQRSSQLDLGCSS